MADEALTSEQSKELDLIKKRWVAAEKLRRQYDYLWELCIRKHAGQHWLAYNMGNHTFQNARSIRRDMELRRTNLIRRDYRVLKSIMKRSFPKPLAQPGPGDGTAEKKRIAADVANGLIENWNSSLKRTETLDRVIGTCLVIGNAFQATAWDTEAPTAKINVDEDEVEVEFKNTRRSFTCTNCNGEGEAQAAGFAQVCPSCNAQISEAQIVNETFKDRRLEVPKDDDGKPLQKEVSQGDVAAPFISPLEIYPQIKATSLDDAAYIFRLRLMPTEWVEKVTNSDPGSVKASSQKQERLKEWDVNFVTGAINDTYTTDTDNHEIVDLAFFLEYLEKPNVKNPKGRYMAFGDESMSKPLIVKNYPQTDEPFGLVKYGYIDVPGRFWDAGFVEDAYPINDQLNSEVTQSDYMRSRFLYSKWVIFQGSDVRDGALSGENDIIEVPDKEQTPQLITPAVPPQLEKSVGLTYKRFEDMSGVTESLGGEQPGSTRAGNAIAQLNEAALGPILDVVANMAVQEAKLYKSLLRLAQTKYAKNREILIEVMGSGSDNEFKVFAASDFKEPGLTIKVNHDIMVPLTRDQKRQSIQLMLQYTGGKFFEIVMQDPQQLQNVLEMAGLKRENWNIDWSQQERSSAIEAERFLNGETDKIVIDIELDNHQIHANQNERTLNSKEGLALRHSPDKEKRAKFDGLKAHRGEHVTELQRLQAEQAGAAPAPPPTG